MLQETFLAVWKNANTYRPLGTPEAWLWVIAPNQAALLRRRGPAALAAFTVRGARIRLADDA